MSVIFILQMGYFLRDVSHLTKSIPFEYQGKDIAQVTLLVSGRVKD